MRRSVALSTMMALVAAGCGSGAPPGQPPQRIAAGFYSCPAEAPTIVVNRVFYPVTYPTPPSPSVRPSRCFRTSDNAIRAGYRRAPTPHRDVRVDDIYLVPPSRSLDRYCRTSAASAGLPVPCPTLVPAPGTSVVDCGGAAPCLVRGRFLLEGNFIGPPGYVGAGEGAGHLWLLGFRIASRGRYECSTPHRLPGQAEIYGKPAHWLACPPGSELNSGHVLLEWRLRNFIYAVSIHGVTSLNRRLAVVIARHVRLIR
jgi:hypothetical protein